MNAPVFRPANDIANPVGSTPADATLRGIPRHVSAEGCQFVIAGKVPAVGRCLRVDLAPDLAIHGTIRWVLGDRIGFAFDRRVVAAALAVLSSPLAGALPIEPLEASSLQEED